MEEGEEGNALEGTQPVLGMAVIEMEPPVDKRAQWPPPHAPPPVVPKHLTCPENMTPTAVGLLRSTIVTVRTLS